MRSTRGGRPEQATRQSATLPPTTQGMSNKTAQHYDYDLPESPSPSTFGRSSGSTSETTFPSPYGSPSPDPTQKGSTRSPTADPHTKGPRSLPVQARWTVARILAEHLAGALLDLLLPPLLHALAVQIAPVALHIIAAILSQ